MIECLRRLVTYCKLMTAYFLILGIVMGSSPMMAKTTASTETAMDTFKVHCVICHAADGSGTALGNRLHVRDLRTKEVQEKSTAELAQIISTGKNNMPAFKDKLGAEQIQKLIEYIQHEIPKQH